MSFRLSSCEGKDKFDTFEIAMEGVSGRLRHLVQPYLCQVCGSYHVGSIETKRKIRLAKTKLKEKKCSTDTDFSV